MQEMRVHSLGWEDPLEEEMESNPWILTWEIPRTEEPGGLQSMGSQRVGYDLATEQQQQQGYYCLKRHVVLLLSRMCHSGWEGGLGENGYLCMHG